MLYIVYCWVAVTPTDINKTVLCEPRTALADVQLIYSIEIYNKSFIHFDFDIL